MKTRALSILTAAAMLLTLLPSAALAEELPQEQCSCVSLCTEGDISPDCPVCGAEGAELSTVCKPVMPDPEPDPDPAPEPTVQTVTGWSWVDEDGALSGNTLTIPNQGGDAPAWEQVASSLPTEITATVAEVSDPVTLALNGWTCEGYDPAVSGRYSAATTLADDTYTLGADVTPLALTVELAPPEGGGANLLEANSVTAGAFTLTSDNALTSGTDYEYSNNTLTIKSGTAVTISGTSTTSDHIVVEDGVTANITLNGVNIDKSGGGCAFEVAGSATCNLTLADSSTNTLKSGSGKAGLQVQGSAILTITENGNGSVTVNGGAGGAGIGGGDASAGGEITISGGSVTATGGNNAAGIGGGTRGAGGNITINGGTVKANSGNANGIGCGRNGAGGNITISGGTVTATGGDGRWDTGTGISGVLTVNGGVVTAKSGPNGGKGITGAISSDGEGAGWIVANTLNADISGFTSGVLIGDGAGKVYGSPTIKTAVEVPSGADLTVPTGSTLTMDSGVTLTNSGTISNQGTISGTLTNSGGLTNGGTISGTLTNNGTIYNSGSLPETIGGSGTVASGDSSLTTLDLSKGSITIGAASVSGKDASGSDVTTPDPDGYLIMQGDTGTMGNTITVTSGPLNVTLSGVNIDKSGNNYTCAFDMANYAVCNLTLADGSTNTLKSGHGKAGLHVPASAELTIGGSGTLNANGGQYSAGIGGTENEDAGSVTINSGTVTVNGGGADSWNYGGAGIGGGGKGAGGTVIINGGTVTATGGADNGGIGGENGGTLIINGGVVIADSNSGIGVRCGELTMNGSGFLSAKTNEALTTTVTQGFLMANGSATAAGTVTLPQTPAVTIDSGKALTVNSGATLTVPSGVTLTVNGVVQNHGTISNSGTVSGGGYLMGNTISGGTANLKAPSPGSGRVNVADGNVVLYETGYSVGNTVYAYDVKNSGVTLHGTTDKNSVTVSAQQTIPVTLENLSVDVSQKSLCAFAMTGADVTLTLTGENRLKSANDKAGLLAPAGATLLIQGSGSLTATGGGNYGGAGIGGDSISKVGGNITITGGTVIATGGGSAVGIGGSYGGAGGNITISGGTVTATGSRSAAGIGGGSSGAGGNITISGGTVTANGGSGAGIGGGTGGAGGNITISGGTVTANGGNDSAGIGGGYGSAGGNITISGGTVTANGGGNGAGIGGGGNDFNPGGAGGNITISGGTVTATSSNGAGIGGGQSGASGIFSTGESGNAFLVTSSIQDKSKQSGWSGVIFEGSNNGKVFNSPITLTTDAEIPSGKTLEIESAKALTVGGGVTLTNRGTITGGGALTNNGTIKNHGTNNMSIGGSGTVQSPSTVAVTLSSSSTVYGNTAITITATAAKQVTNALLRSAAVNKVDFWLGAASTGVKLGTANVSSNAATLTMDGNVWAAGGANWTIGSNTITADFGGTSGTSGLIENTGTATLTVRKADQTAAPGAPILSSATASGITLNAVSGSGHGALQYGYQAAGETSPGHWQTGTSFTGLTAATAYTFFTRFAGDSYHNAAVSTSGTTLYTLPATPTGTTGYTIQYANETATAASGYELNTDNGGTWYTDAISVAPGSAFYVRVKATGSVPASAAQTVTAPTRTGAPTVTIDFSTEKLNTTTTMQYSTDSGANWTDCTANMAATTFGWDGTAEKTVQFRDKATGDAYASEAQSVTIPKRPDAPTTLQGVNETFAGQNDGKITGTSALMEYKISTGSWTDCSGNSLTSLAPGTYSVRLKAVTTDGSKAFASAAATVTIASGAQHTYTLNVTAPSFDPVTVGYADQPQAKAVTISSTGNTNATISGVALGGTNAASFTLNKTDGTSIAAGGTDNATYTVRPNASLAVGTYTAAITVTYNNSATATATVTFTVRANTHTVAFDSRGGSAVASATVTDGEKAVRPADPARSGYTFSGWYKESACANEWKFDTDTVTGNVTLYAKWTQNSSGGGYTPSTRPSAKVDGTGGTVKTGSGTVTITPDEGYRIAKVTVNGKEVSVPEDGKLTGLKGRDKVVVTFEKIPEKPTVDMSKYTDLDAGAWYFEAARYVVEHDLFAGTSDTTFSPNSPMTRAMLMTVLARADGQDTAAPEGGKWYDVGMTWAVEHGISDGTNPDGALTREQLAAMLYRYAGSPATTGTLDGFTDADKAGSYAADALKWAVEQGIITGKGNGILDPKGNATRAEVAAMLMRYFTTKKD